MKDEHAQFQIIAQKEGREVVAKQQHTYPRIGSGEDLVEATFRCMKWE